jgi:membrane protein required for beta-lactamase induction
MADHKHGEMNTDVQEKTFNGFMSMVTKASITIIIALILLAIING